MGIIFFCNATLDDHILLDEKYLFTVIFVQILFLFVNKSLNIYILFMIKMNKTILNCQSILKI